MASRRTLTVEVLVVVRRRGVHHRARRDEGTTDRGVLVKPGQYRRHRRLRIVDPNRLVV